MGITTVLFDLDGTLLPMDQEKFTEGYFHLLSEKLTPYGYDAQELVKAIWSGTAAMVQNDGSCVNKTAFWKTFSEIYGDRVSADKHLFDEFYEREFEGVRAYCGYNPKAADAVRKIRQMGYHVVLATNPIFPAVATEARTRWAGLEPDEFEFYTTYENSHFCKPNPEYYREIADRLQITPGECLMVGNDVTEDMVARNVGMQVFLLTDCLINRERKDINRFPRGSYHQLLKYMKEV